MADETHTLDSGGQQQPGEHGHDGFSPTGTLLFVLLMLLGYAMYWAYLWFIVVIERS